MHNVTLAPISLGLMNGTHGIPTYLAYHYIYALFSWNLLKPLDFMNSCIGLEIFHLLRTDKLTCALWRCSTIWSYSWFHHIRLALVLHFCCRDCLTLADVWMLIQFFFTALQVASFFGGKFHNIAALHSTLTFRPSCFKCSHLPFIHFFFGVWQACHCEVSTWMNDSLTPKWINFSTI